MAKIIFLGPLPPPVHGFSNINAMMLAQLTRVAKVAVFDRSPNAVIENKVMRQLAMVGTTLVQIACFAKTILSERTDALYLGFSGGLGQLLDLPFILIARISHVPIYIHHHSFAYFTSPSRLTKICLISAGNANQIVLCSAMADHLAERYGVAKGKITQVSNSSFMPAGEETPRNPAVSPVKSVALRVGFLGNITAEKGIFRFIEVVRLAKQTGLNIEPVIAGPVPVALREQFLRSVADVPGLEYLGGLYGIEKQRFYGSIDLLLFPTDYVNEAEPVTIWEALAMGVEVVATCRGCISDVIGPGCGECAEAAKFSHSAIEAMTRQLAMTQDARNALRTHIQSSFTVSQTNSQLLLKKLISHIAGEQLALID